MKKAYIKAIDYYLPERILTNDEISKKFPEWSADKVTSKVGIEERHISGDDETAGDMAYKAAIKLFNENNKIKESIDFIILCSQSVDYKLPTTACILQDKLGLKKECGAFDFNLGCSGYEYGLAIAKGLICTGIATNVLLLTAETYSKYINPNDKGNLTIFGDAASATVVSSEGFAEIGEFVLGTDGSGFKSLILETGGARNRNPTGISFKDEMGNKKFEDYLYMNGGAIFDFTANIVPSMINQLLIKEKLTHEDISLWVFHQANKYMINYLRKLIGIDKNKFYIFMDKVGNTVSSTIPIALSEASKQDRLHGNIILAGFGVGLSWGGTVIRCK